MLPQTHPVFKHDFPQCLLCLKAHVRCLYYSTYADIMYHCLHGKVVVVYQQMINSVSAILLIISVCLAAKSSTVSDCINVVVMH